MERTRKPTVAGVLDIISGALGMFLALFLLFVFYVGTTSGWIVPEMEMENVPEGLPSFFLGLGIFTLIATVLALIGGIFILQRRRWGWSLAGSIAAIILFFPLGVLTTILVAMSKNEFV